jgi:hypothetical protein
MIDSHSNDVPFGSCVDGSLLARDLLNGDAELVGAAMCPACLCGADLWPLAIMLSADQVPVNSTQSRCCTG